MAYTAPNTKQEPPSPAKPVTPYALLTHAFVLVSSTKSRITITTVLTNLLRIHDPDAILSAVYLIFNHIAPPYDGVDFGLGGSVLHTAVQSVTGKSNRFLKNLWDRTHDAGDVAFEAKKDIKMLTKPAPITVAKIGLSESVPLRIGSPFSLIMLASITRSLSSMFDKLGTRAFVDQYEYDGQESKSMPRFCRGTQSQTPTSRQATDAYPPLNGEPLSAKQIKPEWKAALDAAVKAGKIPNIPPSSSPDGGTPTYPAGTDMTAVCSWSASKCQGPNDIHQGADNYVGINFDDGPTQSTPRLNQFLLKNNISATRFLIGGQVAGMTSAFKDIIKDPNQQLAVHTYTHHQMTTLTNEQVAAELGWTLQVILDLSGFLPSLWRGPLGDVDNRVRAIAEELFGLIHVSWNYDTNDWCFGQSPTQTACPGETPGETPESVTQYIDNTLAGPKAPGVLMLEHELSDTTVGFFEEHTWTGIQKNGWKHANVAEMLGLPWYTNAASPKGPKTTPTSVLKVGGLHATDAVAGKNGTAATGGASGTAASGAAAGTKPAGSTAGASTAGTTGVKKSSASSMVATSGAVGSAIVALAAAAICAMLV
ncbi:unnamed protein product [Tilletia caries]|uniref:chitin deacetylase n=1 Tax=Tilletia caries TaxID=13290 RepID=A0ABN7J8X9_9BASI|nr:unnamed protein product [Tilletia caries]